MKELERIVGAEHVARRAVVGDAAVAGVAARALVRPGSAREVADVVAWCYGHGVPIVPVGGRSGLAGGAAVLDGTAVAIALDRLRAVRVEPELWRMQAGAGVTTHTIARLARENGLYFPPDPGAAEQSQLGGTIATNAGGPHAWKYGVTGAWVTGIEAVLAPGELVRVGGPLRKDVAGYDLRALLTGSEGTLGIVTAAWLRLVPAPEAQLPVLATFADTAAGCAAIERVLGGGIQASALEYLDAATTRLSGDAFPGGALRGFVVLAEADGTAAQAAAIRDELVEALSEGAVVLHGAQDAATIRALWRWRAGVAHAVRAARGDKLSEDVAVPAERLAEAVDEVVAIGARHRLDACSWGHAGDGNLHATFLLEPGDAALRERADAAAHEVFELALRLGGTVSGEHGIGVLKRGWLSRQWQPAAVAAHRAIKSALDPKGLLNPGKKEP
ncbi:MAG TPA: FAD-linked oxidase C-terminal domain-containing protein [Solirubrobacteraceae bacterium]|jgi:FAD/FMN-containing dehydrogenase|nr:FAD-linked oxidase C-terminal domain-containing protein [Solirubrobacteraceae bacterium]